jgi:indolepyruvate ferredoxin oxidoreductase alpha subunit
MDKSASHETMPKMTVSEDCTGCMSCIEEVECPALIWVENDLRVVIDENLCNGCAICVRACPAGVIDVKEGGTI